MDSVEMRWRDELRMAGQVTLCHSEELLIIQSIYYNWTTGIIHLITSEWWTAPLWMEKILQTYSQQVLFNSTVNGK